MGSASSKLPRPPQAPEQKIWRQLGTNSFREEHERLKKIIGAHNQTHLNMVLIGHTGAGKSSFINSIFSISRGRITSLTNTTSENSDGVGTSEFVEVGTTKRDLFANVRIFDTTGFTGTFGQDETGISDEQLKAVCSGRFKVGEKFFRGKEAGAERDLSDDEIKRNRPHVIVFVTSAGSLINLEKATESIIQQKLKNLRSYVAEDIARVVVITKCDRLCDDVHSDIENIFKNNIVLQCVEKAEELLGPQQNHIFPIVNFTNELEVDIKKSVPVMYALKYALDFAQDKAEERERRGNP